MRAVAVSKTAVGNEKTGKISEPDTKSERKKDPVIADVYSFMPGAMASTGYSTPRTGADFTQVPVLPSLRTAPAIQRCSKGMAPCSCPECSKESGAADDELASADVASTVGQEPQEAAMPEAAEGSGETTTGAESAQAPESVATAMLVPDSSESLQEGQMRKSTFMQELRSGICSAIGPILATAGQTTDGCPYLNYWLDLYQQKEVIEIESTVKRYAPDSRRARSAQDYISLIVQRAVRSAAIWARTGQLSGIPEAAMAGAPGAPAVSASPRGAAIQAKAKNGGPRNADDPASIRSELGEGSPLETPVRSRMESAFGMNFSNVRTHTDAHAGGISNRVNARAFTVGQHVAFGAGEYKPGTMLGDALIAHELAHTIQQGSGSESVGKMEMGSSGYEQMERDADRSAIGVMGSLWNGAKEGLKGLAQRTMPMLRSGLAIQKCSSGSINSRENACTTNATPRSPQKTITMRPTYAWGGSTSAKFTSQMTYANNVYKVAGIALAAGTDLTINETDTKAILGNDAKLDNEAGSTNNAEETALFAKNRGANEVSVYYVKDLEKRNAIGTAYPSQDLFAQSTSAGDRTLAHELGHILAGLDHPSNLDNIVAQTKNATGVDCLSDEQIDAARSHHVAR